ncbi:transcription factor Opi1-domain-containing protein [Mortierella sp. GBAus27b]|nr:transcription factor Opi1-domain-containing protein [Mortierella sp. GBAus27b]
MRPTIMNGFTDRAWFNCLTLVTLRQRSDSQSSQRSYQYHGSSNGYYSQQGQVSTLSSTPAQQFSGWRGVVATVGTASAAGVAIFSEESMKSLKYCLQWLQYAVHHIDHQIGLLRQFLASLASPSSSTAISHLNAASTLASIKNEVVETLRKVINVVSRYAGACLPEQAKFRVREFILSMPVRWATINNESVPSTPIGSPSLGPQSDRSPEQQAALNETSSRATKVLSLANESSDMLKSVAYIFKDSVDKAENWMDKLRYVGMNPQNNSEGLPSWAPTGFPGSPGGAGGMPGTFPGFGAANANASGTGLEQYSLRQTQTQHSAGNTNGFAQTNGSSQSSGSPTRSLKGSPRMGSRENFIAHRHAYRQKSVMSGDEDSGSDEEEAMYESDDENCGRAPLKRTKGSATHTQGNPVRRRKTKSESVDAGLVSSIGAEPQAIKQEL